MDVARLKDLIAERERIDAEIVAAVNDNEPAKRKMQTCSICHQEGHSARTCPQKERRDVA